MKKRTLITLLIIFLIGCGCYAWFASAQKKTSNETKLDPPPVPVVVAKVQRRSVPVEENLIGRAEAKASVTLRSRVDGQITSIEFQEGAPVKKGQVLVRLDPASFATQLSQVQANQARDQAQLLKLRADLIRYTDLAKQGFISNAQLSQTQADLAAAEATGKADAGAVENAQLTLSYAVIRAPMDGVAGALQVYPGGIVRANDTALLLIHQVDPIYVSFNVAETHLTQLKAALTKGPVLVRANLASTLSDKLTTAAAAPVPMQGRIAFIDNAVDTTTGTILAKALFENAERHLTPGQFVNISVLLEVLPDVLVVPSNAVQTSPKGNFIFVVKADDTVEARPVAVKAALASDSVIGSGVEAGETIVIDGQLRLKPGSHVKFVNDVGTSQQTASTAQIIATAP